MVSGLLCGLQPFHVRLLVDDPWNGGHGKSLEEIGRMSIDQALFLLADRKTMKGRKGTMTTKDAFALVDKDGYAKGRDAEGKPMRAKLGGRSLASRLIEEARVKEKAARPRRRRGG